ncbi:MAG: 3-oxoacyl-ACP synthase III family protein [Actinomycetota bacterium]
MRVAVTGIGKAVPERVVTNAEIGERLGVDPEWIEVRTGIRERRFAAPGESASTFGAAAARAALACAGRSADEIDFVIAATCTGDHQFPSTSTVIQHAIGATSAGAFDVGAACSGFIYSLAIGAGLAAGGSARRLLVVGTDVLSAFINLADPITSPLFGDGAGAVVLEADDAAEPMRFELGADGGGGKFVLVPAGGSRFPASRSTMEEGLHFIQMAGREVYRSAVRTMTSLGASFGEEGFDLLVAHQANRRIIDECTTNLGIDPQKVFMNIDRYGNTSAASVPIAVCEAWEIGRLKPGARLLMLAFGSGYTWGGASMRWTLPYPPPTAAETGEVTLSGAGRNVSLPT